MPDQRELRMAANEVVARAVNDSIERAAPPDGRPPSGFICECAREQCEESVDIAIEGYVGVRSFPRRFIVAPGHEEPEIEAVVDAQPGFLLVEKLGGVGEMAEAWAR